LDGAGAFPRMSDRLGTGGLDARPPQLNANALGQTTQALHETAITDARGGLSDGPKASSIARTWVFVMRARHEASTDKEKVVARTVNEGA
jgi:hypothetical protein